MNCAVHSDQPVAAYCRTCGKALCESCKRPVRGVVFCEDCLAHRVQDTVPKTAGEWVAQDGLGMPPGSRVTSPGLAAVLGFIPGVGAMYNGQFVKAFVHVLIFASLIWAADREGIFGVLIPFFIFYMVFDAYQTARAMELGKPLPDPLGLNKMFGEGPPPHMPTGTANAPSTAGAQGTVVEGTPYPASAEEVPVATYRRAPVGAVILIGIGVLFLLDNLDWFEFRFVHRLWPLLLIIIGLWLFYQRLAPRNPGQQQ